MAASRPFLLPLFVIMDIENLFKSITFVCARLIPCGAVVSKMTVGFSGENAWKGRIYVSVAKQHRRDTFVKREKPGVCEQLTVV